MKSRMRCSIVTFAVTLLWAASTNAAGTDRSPTPPVRPSYRDVSIKIRADYPYKWWRGRTATQVGRDAMEETLVARAVPEAIRYARTIPACREATGKAIGLLNNVTAKLGNLYEQADLKLGDGTTPFPGGSWSIPAYGRHYRFEQYALKAIRDCSASGSGRAACAVSPLLTASLLDLLDLRVEAGQCIRGASFVATCDYEDANGVPCAPPLEAYNSYRAGVGVVQSKARMPTPDAALLHATHAAHLAVSDWRCMVGPPPTAGIVQAAHVALEASAETEDQHHFLRLKDFEGFVDGWMAAEACRWARLQDRFHERWMVAVGRGEWGAARRADDDHQLAHVCMGLRDDRLLVRFSCAPDDIRDCPVLTCRQALAALAGP
jgi:hypothetical protein